jgi:hypothetical protein
MDVTVLEEAISHFLPFTPPFSKFSAGCFSSCKFQIKNNSCKYKERKKSFETIIQKMLANTPVKL